MELSSLSTNSLQRVVARDAEAWQRVLQLYQPLLYSRCRRRGLAPADAADVVQDVLMAAFKGVDGFRRDGVGASFRGWLLGIAANKLKDHWERKELDPQGAGGSESQRRLDQIGVQDDLASGNMDEASEKAALVRRALELIQGDFQERTWKAFWRFDIDGQPAAAVAVELSMTPNAVHVSVSRVRKRLREEFADLL